MVIFFISELRNFLFDKNVLRSHKLPGITISVGNIELGGTGKTPTVIAICKLLVSRGQRPVILTRGYKSGLKNFECAFLKDGKYAQTPRVLTADEAMECSQELSSVPIVLGARRYEAAQKFLKFDSGYAPTHWVLDDGFQHRKILRDIDLVLVTPSFSLSPWAVFPFGKQRESGKNIQRATAVLLSKFSGSMDGIVEKLSAYNNVIFPLEFKFEGLRQVSGESTSVGQKPVVITGIAKPDMFYEMLSHHGITWKEKHSFRDHELIPWEKFSDQDIFITTAKDFCRAVPPKQLRIFIAVNSAFLDSQVRDVF